MQPVSAKPLESPSSGLFVSAIHTDSGKTLASALLCLALQADYWKPVQCGFPTDSDQIRSWLGTGVHVHPEQYRLRTPASPHFAAAMEPAAIRVSDFRLPVTQSRNLVVEGAGGLLVPLNENETLADLIQALDLPLVLVVNHYLGALNHSLLTLREIHRRGIRLAGLIFNGTDFQDAESVLLRAAGCPCLLRLPRLEEISRPVLEDYAARIQFHG